MRADLHIHTVHSGDSRTTPQQVISRCQEAGIDCIAVTDHNTISGALELQQMSPFRVIVGEEIHTRSGEIIGYFMSDEIPKGLPAAETVSLLKRQGAIVCVPHPFDSLRQSALKRRVLHELLGEIDVIEVFNARVMLRRHNQRAARFAAQHGLPASAGSDAHTPGEIGSACVEMPDFNDRDDFLSSLSQGKIVGRVSPPWVHLWSNWSRLWKL